MTAKGRLARGKLNYSKNIFLDNSETIDYIKSLKPVIKKPVLKEKKK